MTKQGKLENFIKNSGGGEDNHLKILFIHKNLRVDSQIVGWVGRVKKFYKKKVSNNFNKPSKLLIIYIYYLL